MKKLTMWRHGDVFIQACAGLPASASKLPHLILAKGELTGHAHRIAERESAELFRHDDVLYLRVTGVKATVTHEEHRSIALEPGVYRVWIQREYSPQEIRRVLD
jgi:hypothetical protein